MRKFVSAALAGAAMAAVSLAVSASPAAAVPACRGIVIHLRDSGIQGARAWCMPGTEGDIAAKITCIREDNFKKYTRQDAFRHGNGLPGSKIVCKGADALVDYSYVID